MMDYDYMMGYGGGSMMFFAWIVYLLVMIFLALAIVALWKYISKK